MSKTYLQLARTGDILALLPLLYQDSLRGEKPRFVVHKDYVSVLEGVSYVEPVVWQGDPHDIGGACQWAGEVTCCQMNAPPELVKQFTYQPSGCEHAMTTSFVKDMWRAAGRLKEWDQCYPLVFDRRSKLRESALLTKVGLNDKRRKKPLMLVALEGNSSQFKHRDLLLELLRGRFGQAWNILELPQAERLYDLLALYEKAECLVAIDSAPLHLARACTELPVVALTNDSPTLWYGSPWEPNHIFYCRYKDFPDRAKKMLEAIEKRTINRSEVIVWNACEDEELYGGMSFPIVPGMCGRDATMQGDKKRVPFLKDALRMALQRVNGGSVCVTRSRVTFEPEQLTELCYAYRIQNGTCIPVCDWFRAKASFWKEHMDEIPNLLLGSDHNWSHCLWWLFKKNGAKDVTGAVFREPSKNAKPYDVFAPRNKHNKKLTDIFVREQKIYSRYPKVSEQVEVVANFSTQFRHGYNPSIIEHEGKILMVLRYHPIENVATNLMLAELNPDFSVAVTRPLDLAGNGQSAEDPKWFKRQGKLFMSWVDCEWPMNPKAVIRYGKYEYEHLQDFAAPDLPGNDGTQLMKNWVFWEWMCQPWLQPYVIYDLGTGHKIEHPQPTWHYGTIRGGTPPIPYEGNLLRFFHGNLDNEVSGARRRYFMGAMLIHPETLEPLKVSKTPVLFGSEIDDLKVNKRPHHWKSSVVFASGLLERSDHWVLSLGINDSSSLLVKIKPEQLNF